MHRLITSRSYNNLDANANAWQTTPSDKMYRNHFTYDANGNILNQMRYDANGTAIDSLTYRYDTDATGLKRNRLYHVNDEVGDNEFADDIDDMGTFTAGTGINTANNYRYDALGQLVADAQEGIDGIEWRNDGKISAIYRSGGQYAQMVFGYGPGGHRLSKAVHDPQTGELLYKNYYIRDAQGNVMATYKTTLDAQSQSAQHSIIERSMYGSDRLGIHTQEDVLHPEPAASTATFKPVYRGLKQYEIKNHLGNVMTTITGHKIPQVTGSTITHYHAQLSSTADYSPFGVQLDGRTWQAEGYRYGFNGQEKDDEIKRAGNSLNFKYRMFDARLGRFFAVDPLTNEYPQWTPYQFAGLTPIWARELEGLEPAFTTETGVEVSGSDHLFNYNPDFLTRPDIRPAPRIEDILFPKNTNNLTVKAALSAGYKGFNLELPLAEFDLERPSQQSSTKLKVISYEVTDNTEDLMVMGGGTIFKSAMVLVDEPVKDKDGNVLMDFQVFRITERTEIFTIGGITTEARDLFINDRRMGPTEFQYGLDLSKGYKLGKGENAPKVEIGMDIKTTN